MAEDRPDMTLRELLEAYWAQRRRIAELERQLAEREEREA